MAGVSGQVSMWTCELCTVWAQNTPSQTQGLPAARDTQDSGLPPVSPVCPLSRSLAISARAAMNFHYSGQTLKKIAVGVKSVTVLWLANLTHTAFWLAHWTYTGVWLVHLTQLTVKDLFRLKLASQHLTLRKTPRCSFIESVMLNLRSSGCSGADEQKMGFVWRFLINSCFVTMQRNVRTIFNFEPKTQYCGYFVTDLPPLCVWVLCGLLVAAVQMSG